MTNHKISNVTVVVNRYSDEVALCWETKTHRWHVWMRKGDDAWCQGGTVYRNAPLGKGTNKRGARIPTAQLDPTLPYCAAMYHEALKSFDDQLDIAIAKRDKEAAERDAEEAKQIAEHEAREMLITAAPDMLAALKEFVEIFAHGVTNSARAETHIQTVLGLIRKAEGR